MKEFIRILRDLQPPAANNQGGPTPPVEPAPPAAVPKSKEEWDKLAQEDPQRWISLTQTRMDQAVRQAREAQEKLAAEQAKARNMAIELENLRRGPVLPSVQPPVNDPNKPFSYDNMPQTDDQWEQLWLENPNLASDLRNYKFFSEQENKKQQQTYQTEFNKARRESAQILWERHPDMYVLERDETGNVKKDGNGKPVLKIDPNTNGPIIDLETEKAQLFVQVYSEDAAGYDGAKFGPRLAMVEMERRLQEKAAQKINGAGGSGIQVPAGTQMNQNGLMPGGVQPPVTGPVSFSSDEEKAHALKAVERGIYKNLQEYCSLRDGKHTGFTEENRVPQFG
jgi:hypothetical protein